MSDLFALSAPWWHFVLRAVVIYLMVMLLIRVSGKRAVGQFTPFDLVLLILVGNAVQNGLNGGDNSLTAALLLAFCLILLNALLALVSARSRRVRRWVEGEPVVVVHDGHVYDERLRRQLVSRDDLERAMRDAGVLELAHVRLAVLETSGHITVIAADRARADTGRG
jgi:uncharacterized membrane protein YcaP (DUF421 family)